MIKINNKYIPQPGYVFQTEEGSYLLVSTKELPETHIDITLDSFVEIVPGFVDISGILAIYTNTPVPKDTFMKRLFQESDQISIMLNYLEDQENPGYKKKYEVMQGWRKWFSEVMDMINGNQNI